jgi:hypothetical protein
MKTFIQTSAPVSLGKRQFKDTSIFNPIHYRATGKGNWYEQDLEYFKQPSFGIEQLPVRVQLEHCFKAKIHADYLLTFQDGSGFMRALTGIRKTIIPDWYYGDLRVFVHGQTVTSLVLIQFSPDRSMFSLYLFESYYPIGSKRISTVIKVIQEIKLTGNPSKQVLQTIAAQQSIKGNQKSGNRPSTFQPNQLIQ